MKTSKLSTILIVIATLVLAGVAIYTALRLYNTRDKAVAPTAPTSKPAAQVVDNCSLTFTISTPTPTPTATPTVTPTPTPVPQCDSDCTLDSQCPTDLDCYIPTGNTTGNCRNPQCLTKTDCVCATATPTPTTTPTATPTATATPTITATPTPTATSTSTSTAVTQSQPTDTPELPAAGTSWPTILGSTFGILIIFGALLLAL